MAGVVFGSDHIIRRPSQRSRISGAGTYSHSHSHSNLPSPSNSQLQLTRHPRELAVLALDAVYSSKLAKFIPFYSTGSTDKHTSFKGELL